ncbi:hypothetical protein FHT86_003249 [Rhizobium sp. BK313]|uniref:hypothetical protein n=1 Tax=Rhizobium sp. BK313 TaxID=2587081 RepID=UPI00105E552E|nr:hypothetical protein [Rhizobium sp. BK313]MBB3454950.1 hypothetical protein [Rhizobium sp. BK313]
MCSLCGVLGSNEHWTDAAARPGVFTRGRASPDRRRERVERVRAANEMLAGFGLVLSDWQGASFVLSTKTGRTEIVEDLGHLWPAAERLVGRACDPLDAAFIARMEARRVD